MAPSVSAQNQCSHSLGTFLLWLAEREDSGTEEAVVVRSKVLAHNNNDERIGNNLPDKPLYTSQLKQSAGCSILLTQDNKMTD